MDDAVGHIGVNLSGYGSVIVGPPADAVATTLQRRLADSLNRRTVPARLLGNQRRDVERGHAGFEVGFGAFAAS